MKRLVFLCAALLLSAGALRAQRIAPFVDGDRAAFLGNSITDGGHYHSYIWLYYMTRFPERDVRIFNAGIGGETAAEMTRRLDGDVFSKRPTVLMATFGMNDTGYVEYNGDDAAAFGESRYRQCREAFAAMEQRLLAADGLRVVMLGGSPYDETAQIESTAFKGKNAVMRRVVALQQEAAERNGWEFLDFGAPLLELTAREQAADPSFTLSMGDRIHPDNAGHMAMAYLFLRAQGFAGQEVADVRIDAAKVRTLRASNCAVSALRRQGRTLSFDYLAEALPYPTDTVARGMGAKHSQAEALRMVPFTEEMNREMLAVEGLAKGDYTLTIDGERIGTWSAAELAAGINLAEIRWAPQYRQALEVMYLNEWRWEIERNFRDLAWVEHDYLQEKGLLHTYDRRAVEAIDRGKSGNIWLGIHRDTYARYMLPHVREARQREMEQLTQTIYEINRPQLRRVELRRE